MAKQSIYARIGLTIFLCLTYIICILIFSEESALITSKVAGNQLIHSDEAYRSAKYTFGVFSNIGLWFTALFTILLICTWFKVAVWLAMRLMPVAIMAVVLAPTPSHAFFAKTDRTEAYPILPNETAFWVPEIGNSKDNQASTNNEGFWKDRKISFSRFTIPHQKLTGSAGTSWLSGWDFYVPTGRLFKVNRSPFSREWVDSENKGSSAKKEGFQCQSNEGLDVTSGIAISATISEQDAAKYLAKFGVKSTNLSDYKFGNSIEADGEIIFQSVYYAKSLTEVMDDFGRKKISELICDEMMTRNIQSINADSKKIKDVVAKNAAEFFKDYGITIEFFGWADTFNYAPEVQSSLNRLMAAKVDAESAKILAPHADVIRSLAHSQALRTFGERTDGKLPGTFVGISPEMISSILSGMVTGGAKSP